MTISHDGKRLWVFTKDQGWHESQYIFKEITPEYRQRVIEPWQKRLEAQRRAAQTPSTRRPLQEIQLTENPNESNVDVTNGVKIEDPVCTSPESDCEFMEPPPHPEVALGFEGDADAWQSFKV
jgi:hypothetical protein